MIRLLRINRVLWQLERRAQRDKAGVEEVQSNWLSVKKKEVDRAENRETRQNLVRAENRETRHGNGREEMAERATPEAILKATAAALVELRGERDQGKREVILDVIMRTIGDGSDASAEELEKMRVDISSARAGPAKPSSPDPVAQGNPIPASAPVEEPRRRGR